ncbi:MAG: NAD-glutamate dehydrogenase, partial [Ignavibacteriales bacterium]
MKGASLHPAPPACDLETLIEAFARPLRLEPRRLPTPERQFLQQVHDDCAADELSGFSPTDIGAAMAALWKFGEGANGEPLIRLRPWKGESGARRDLLEIVQDDRPFLVDSIMGEVAEGGYSVRAMVHPVVEVEGGKRRSFIQVHLDPVGEDRAESLIAAVRAVLTDVRVAVDDFEPMLALMHRSIEELAAARIPASEEERAEALAFLRWLEGERFVFLGARIYEYPRTADGGYAHEEPLITPEGNLGVLRDESRSVLRRANEPAILSPHVRRYLETDSPLIVAKSNLRSRVHRRGYMDYVGVKRYGADGRPSGEVRFVGLFTAEAYEEPVREVPLIRRKAAHVLARANTVPGGHNEKRLR